VVSSLGADSSTGELLALVEQLWTTNAGLREVINGQTRQLQTQAGRLLAQADRIAKLEDRLRSDSTS
jgi:hypothetical protein